MESVSPNPLSDFSLLGQYEKYCSSSKRRDENMKERSYVEVGVFEAGERW